MQKITRKRTRSRNYAVQMTYSSMIAETDYNETVSSYRLEYPDEDDDIMDFAEKLFAAAYDNKEHDEELISKFISKSWSIDRVGSIERCILRLGVSELFKGDTPFYAIIDDYVTLAKSYGDDKSAAFVNGVLENIKNKFSIELENGTGKRDTGN